MLTTKTVAWVTYAARLLIAALLLIPITIWSFSNLISGTIAKISILAYSIGKLTPAPLRRNFFSNRLWRMICSLAQVLCIVQSLFVPADQSVDCRAAAEHSHHFWEGPLHLPQEEPSTNCIAKPLSFPALPDYFYTNFALAENGAEVIPALTSPTADWTSPSYIDKLLIFVRGFDKTQTHVNPPLVVLENHSKTDCWKFKGSHGHIAMSLSNTVLWRGFTVHFPDQHSLTLRPKELALWALVSRDEVDLRIDSLLLDWKAFVVVEQLLNPLTFNSSVVFQQVAQVTLDALNERQGFPMRLPVQTSVVLVQVLDNWGNDSTCLHRISIHGDNV